MNYNETFSEKNTIACRNNGVEVEAHGCGHYEQKAYNPIIKTVAEAEGFTLRTIESVGIKYEIVWDGEVLNRYPNLKTAETFFMDFAGITKAKYNKIKNAA